LVAMIARRAKYLDQLEVLLCAMVEHGKFPHALLCSDWRKTSGARTASTPKKWPGLHSRACGWRLPEGGIRYQADAAPDRLARPVFYAATIQRAMIGQKLANLKHGQHSNAAAVSIDTAQQPITRDQAAEKVGSTPLAISKARIIIQWAPEIAKKVGEGVVSLDAAFKEAPGWPVVGFFAISRVETAEAENGDHQRASLSIFTATSVRALATLARL